MTRTADLADPDHVASLTARMLVEIKAVHFNGQTLFIFTSGWARSRLSYASRSNVQARIAASPSRPDPG